MKMGLILLGAQYLKIDWTKSAMIQIKRGKRTQIPFLELVSRFKNNLNRSELHIVQFHAIITKCNPLNSHRSNHIILNEFNSWNGTVKHGGAVLASGVQYRYAVRCPVFVGMKCCQGNRQVIFGTRHPDR